MKILAQRAIGDALYVVLDGSGDSLVPGDRLLVEDRATLRVHKVGLFPVCRVTRLQTGLGAEALVGLEAAGEGAS
jgi:hypothetical protein